MAGSDPHNRPLDINQEKLLNDVKDLNALEFELLLQQLLAARSDLIVPSLGVLESALLKQVNVRLPESEQTELDSLIDKRKAESLSDTELQRIIYLTTELEKLNVQRMEFISQLSSLQNLPMPELMRQMDISIV